MRPQDLDSFRIQCFKEAYGAGEEVDFEDITIATHESVTPLIDKLYPLKGSEYLLSPERDEMNASLARLLEPGVLPIYKTAALLTHLLYGVPPYYYHDRLAEDGTTFQVQKITTLTAKKDDGSPQVPLGWFSKKFRSIIDELPQIQNAVEGGMYLFGIRAISPEDVNKLYRLIPMAFPEDGLKLCDAYMKAYYLSGPAILGHNQNGPWRKAFSTVNPNLIRARMLIDIAYVVNASMGFDLLCLSNLLKRIVFGSKFRDITEEDLILLLDEILDFRF